MLITRIQLTLGVLVLAGATAYAGWQGYELGTNNEKSKWQTRLLDYKESTSKALSEHQEAVRLIHARQQTTLMGALNERDQKIQQLNAANARLASRGLFVDSTCSDGANSGLPRTTGDTSVGGGASRRVRLSSEDERRQIVARLAERVNNKSKATEGGEGGRSSPQSGACHSPA